MGPEKTVGGKHAPPEVPCLGKMPAGDQIIEIDGLFRHGVDRTPYATRASCNQAEECDGVPSVEDLGADGEQFLDT